MFERFPVNCSGDGERSICELNMAFPAYTGGDGMAKNGAKRRIVDENRQDSKFR